MGTMDMVRLLKSGGHVVTRQELLIAWNDQVSELIARVILRAGNALAAYRQYAAGRNRRMGHE